VESIQTNQACARIGDMAEKDSIIVRTHSKHSHFTRAEVQTTGHVNLLVQDENGEGKGDWLWMPPSFTKAICKAVAEQAKRAKEKKL